MSQTTINGIINGVDVDRLGATVEAVRRTPTLATFRFHAANHWIDDSHNRSTIKSFYGAGQEDTIRTTPFVLDTDKPPDYWERTKGQPLSNLCSMHWQPA